MMVLGTDLQSLLQDLRDLQTPRKSVVLHWGCLICQLDQHELSSFCSDAWSGPIDTKGMELFVT